MLHLSRKNIEAIANRITTAYKRLPALQDQSPNMVQPELLIHDLLGLNTEYHTLSRNGSILGLTACGETDVRIYDDPKHPEFFHLDGKTLLIDSYLVKEGANIGRYHFTLTHEACHQIFKMLFPREYASPVRLRQVHCCTVSPSESGDYWEEWRTNALASAILMPEDIRKFLACLREERFTLAAETLAKMSAPLLEEMSKPFCEDTPVERYIRLLAMPAKYLLVMQGQIGNSLSPAGKQQLKAIMSAALAIYEERENMIRYTEQNDRGGTNLCTTVSNLDDQLRRTLWSQPRPFLLTSGTLAVGADFRRFKTESGLLRVERITETVAPSPFDYRKNCLLYLPKSPPHIQSAEYYDAMTEEIAKLLHTSHGHGLVLFTSYTAMSAVKERLMKKELPWPLLAMGRNAIHTTEHFKAQPGSVLLATGAAWEGLDFSGDSVSMLIIPRLPFAHPDAISENERKKFPTLRDFIRSAVIPAMQIKLRQGFGRAIRTEHDSIRRWNAGELPVALIHPASAGHGLNLQDGGSALVWFGLTWSLELYQQTNARLWRQGQTSDTVVIQHIIAKDTIDGRILKALREKDGAQAALIEAVKADLKI